MNEKYTPIVGIFLILGVAIGYSLGLILKGNAGMYGAMGAGLGIVLGSIIGHYKFQEK